MDKEVLAWSATGIAISALGGLLLWGLGGIKDSNDQIRARLRVLEQWHAAHEAWHGSPSLPPEQP